MSEQPTEKPEPEPEPTEEPEPEQVGLPPAISDRQPMKPPKIRP